MKIRVSYYFLNSNGAPDGLEKYEVVELNQHPGEDAEAVLQHALSKKLGVDQENIKVMGTAEM